MLKDRHVTNNGSIHKVCANAVNRPVTIEFLHGGIAHGRDLVLAAQQREIRAEVPVAVADRFAERSERVRARLNERMLLFDAPALLDVRDRHGLTGIGLAGHGGYLDAGMEIRILGF